MEKIILLLIMLPSITTLAIILVWTIGYWQREYYYVKNENLKLRKELIELRNMKNEANK